MANFPGLISSQLIDQKKTTIQLAITQGTFAARLRTFAIVNNATQLWNSTSDTILSFDAIIVSPSSDHKYKISSGALAGAIIGCVCGTIFVFFVIYLALVRRQEEEEKAKQRTEPKIQKEVGSQASELIRPETPLQQL